MKAFVLRADRQRPFASVDPWTAPASRVWTNPRVSLEEWPVPERVGAHDVIVRVAWCGICGSDLHCSTAGPDGAVEFGGPARLPVVLGHEFTGTVVDVGSAVANVSRGDLISAESVWSCRACADCAAGHLNECQRAELVGLTIDGALAPFVRVDARHCHSLAPIVGRYGRDHALEAGALLEPFGVAHRGLTRAALRPDDNVVVIGAGPIGLAVVMLAKAAGVSSITVFDKIEARVAAAEAAGARAFNASVLPADPVRLEAVLREFAGGSGASLAVEAGGTASAFEAAFAAAGKRGRVLVLGRLPGPVPLDTNVLLTKALSVIGSRGHAGMNIFQDLVERVGAGTLDLLPLVTARFDLSEAIAAFAHARSGNGKTLIRVDP